MDVNDQQAAATASVDYSESQPPKFIPLHRFSEVFPNEVSLDKINLSRDLPRWLSLMKEFLASLHRPLLQESPLAPIGRFVEGWRRTGEKRNRRRRDESGRSPCVGIRNRSGRVGPLIRISSGLYLTRGCSTSSGPLV